MQKGTTRAIMPPYLVLHRFLDTDTVAGLLAFTLAHEAAFAPTKTGRSGQGKVDPRVRISTGTRELGPFKPIFRSKMLALVPDVVARLRTTPIESPFVELELVAHNDGAFFRHHIDTHTHDDCGSLRVLSSVFYFHTRPKAFSGGALRLYAIGDPARATFVDIEPTHNTLLAFPSWAPHEVRPVSCPSRRFADSRFAINCWVHRARAAASDGGPAAAP
jgi:hypothetical protein